MLLILLGLLLASLPLILSSAFPHLMIISIYSGLGFLLATGWAVLIVTIIARRQRIKEWREARKLKKLQKRSAKKSQ